MSQQNPILLDYAPPSQMTVKFPTPIRLIALLFILPALALPFVKYAGSDSPLDLIMENFPRLAAGNRTHPLWIMAGLCFCAGIPLLLCHLRLLIFGELSKIETWAGYGVAFLGMGPAVMVLSVFTFDCFTNYIGLYIVHESLRLTIGALMVVAAIVIVFGARAVWLLGKRISHGTRICACLSISCVAPLLLFGILVGVHTISRSERLRLGYWLSLLVIAGCLIELTTLAVMALRKDATIRN